VSSNPPFVEIFILTKNDDAITHSCLKTIAAFLNTDGGNLLIGISDSGEVVGIEQDQFPNDDKFLLHLFNVIKSSIGDYTASLIDTDIYKTEEKSVCLVNCKKSNLPVFMQFKGKEEEYFIRTGPSTTKLSPSDAHKHISNNFP